MTPDEKLAYIEEQIREVQRGNSTIITCPYCDLLNAEGTRFCCDLFAQAAIAILHRMEMKKDAELAERIAEQVAKAAAN